MMFLNQCHGKLICNQWIETSSPQKSVEENCDKKTQRTKGKHARWQK